MKPDGQRGPARSASDPKGPALGPKGPGARRGAGAAPRLGAYGQRKRTYVHQASSRVPTGTLPWAGEGHGPLS